MAKIAGGVVKTAGTLALVVLLWAAAVAVALAAAPQSRATPTPGDNGGGDNGGGDNGGGDNGGNNGGGDNPTSNWVCCGLTNLTATALFDK